MFWRNFQSIENILMQKTYIMQVHTGAFAIRSDDHCHGTMVLWWYHSMYDGFQP